MVQGAVSGSTGHHEVEVYDVVHGGVLVYGHSTLVKIQSPRSHKKKMSS
jgi:hypothetical protein